MWPLRARFDSGLRPPLSVNGNSTRTAAGFTPTLFAPVAVLALLALHAFVYKSADTDYAIFARAGTRFVEGSALYRADDAAPSDGSGWSDRTFKYTPASAAFFVPFGALPAGAGRMLYLLLSVAALVVAALWATRESGITKHAWLPLVLFLPLAHHQFSLGQTDALVLGLFAASELTLKKRPWASAVLAAMAVLLKVTFVVPLLVVVLARRGENAVRQLAALGLLGAVLPLRYGVEGAVTLHREWLSLLGKTTRELLCRPANQGVWGIVCEYVTPPPGLLFHAVVVATAALFAFAVWRMRGHSPALNGPLTPALSPTRGEGARFPLAAAAISFAALWSPLCWRSTLTCMLPAYFLAVAALAGPRRQVAGCAVCAAVLAGLPLYDLAGPRVFESALQLRAFGVAALLCVVLATAASAPAPAVTVPKA